MLIIKCSELKKRYLVLCQVSLFYCLNCLVLGIEFYNSYSTLVFIMIYHYNSSLKISPA